MITIPIKKTSPLAKTPTSGSEFSAGYDLCSIEEYNLKPMERHLFTTGIFIAIPAGVYGRIAPRSGLASKNGIDVMAGVIDSDYTGEIKVLLINLGDTEMRISAGDKIAQIIFERISNAEFIDVNELPKTSRGEGGFGSSDKVVKLEEGKIKGNIKDSPTKDRPEPPEGQYTIIDRYTKAGGIPIRKKYSDEIKERDQGK